jgi:F0F1-type ATP synthase assembly protein I
MWWRILNWLLKCPFPGQMVVALVQEKGPDLSVLGLFGLGAEIAAAVVVGIAAGYYLDRWLDSSPWCLVAGTLLGCVMAIYHFLKRVSSVTGRRNGKRS